MKDLCRGRGASAARVPEAAQARSAEHTFRDEPSGEEQEKELESEWMPAETKTPAT